MKSQAKLIEEFEKGAAHGTASHMFIEGDTLYSYGHHFPLAIRFGGPDGYRFLINGDRYSVTTSCHQASVYHLGPQIPFSALRAACIEPEKIEIVDTREDQWHNISDPTPEDPDHKRFEHTLGAALLEYDDRFFLSSLDENEPWHLRSYFLSELPKKEVCTVDEAYESLAPDRVREWRSNPDKASERRQGEWFFLPTDLETRHLPRPTYRGARLLDTSHYVTELRKNDDLYSRGTVRHWPAGRRPQHRILKLGKLWHISVKNTAVGSWSAEGLVD